MSIRLVVVMCLISLGSLWAQQNEQTPTAHPQIATETGASAAERANVSFDPLPAGWIADQQVMDPIWEPLGVRGVNHYAYGGRTSPNEFASRSDPDSPLYQAWFGVYTIAGGKDKFQTGAQQRDFQAAVKLAEYDQRSWLEAMGDPKPVATSDTHPVIATLVIDGAKRTLYSADMQTHSDLSSGSTPLATGIGMPPVAKWQKELSPFHEITLHCEFAFWYDAQRGITVFVYAASSAFKLKSDGIRDNGPALRKQLHEMMQRVRITSNPQPAARK
jgi:hypothetical protein